MGTLTFEFPDFWIFSSNHCIKDIFDTGDLYILTGYGMQEHASLAVLLENTNAFEIWLYEIRQKFTFTWCKQQSLISGKRAFLQKDTEHLNYYPTSIRNTLLAYQKYLPILGKLALLQHSCSL